jgi:hypothetical protein
MNPRCNGAAGVTVSTIECGDVLLASMEDMDAYLRASAQAGEFIRWGCVGVCHPATWNLALKNQEQVNMMILSRKLLDKVMSWTPMRGHTFLIENLLTYGMR